MQSWKANLPGTGSRILSARRGAIRGLACVFRIGSLAIFLEKPVPFLGIPSRWLEQAWNSFQRECMVRMKGLEPLRLSAPDPKSGTATNYATSAFLDYLRNGILLKEGLPESKRTLSEKKILPFP